MTTPTVYLDPLNRAFADAAATQPPLESLTVEQFRAEVELLQQHGPLPGLTRTKFIVPFEDGVITYIFKPDGSTGNLPVVFFFHGGAWVGGKYDHLGVSDQYRKCRG
jgi:acetyl esterase